MVEVAMRSKAVGEEPRFDPRMMSLRGRIGAFVLHASRDPRETTAKARATFLARFERDVDPDGSLPPEERQRRALAARKAHFERLALKSARSRANSKGRPPAGATPIVDEEVRRGVVEASE
jgi:hypothetical protein